MLAEIVRLDRSHHRPVAGDSELSAAIKLVARSHQSLVWDRTRHVLRLRGVLREFFPAAMEALLIWTRRTPSSCSRPRPTRTGPRGVSRAKITATLRRANRRGVEDKAAQIQSVLRAPALRQPVQVQAAFAAIVTSQVRLIGTLNGEIAKLGEVVGRPFWPSPRG